MTTLESLSKLDQKTILAATMYSSMETLGEPKTDAFLETPFDLLDDCFGDSSVQVNGSLTLGLHLGVNLAKLGYIDEIENPKAGGSKAKVVVPAADHS